jgi:tRNA G18 (ribose-2'-O)-methylase SpoU
MASPVARTTEDHATIESVILDPSVRSNPFGQELARRLRKQGVPGVRLSHQLYRDLTLAAEPQGIGAVVRQQWIEMASLKAVAESLWLAVESIESPGNLGMILRTSEASGVAGFSSLVRNAALRSRCCEGEYGVTVLTENDPLFCGVHGLGEGQRSENSGLITSRAAGL